MATDIKCSAFKEMVEATNTLENPSIGKWKAGGGKVVGYFCSSFPEEFIVAAGLLPFRMRATGSMGTDLSDSFFSSNNCSFPRHAFNLALEGKFDFLDGILVFNSCDNVRRIYDHWKRKVDTPFTEFVHIPKKAGEAQIEWFKSELEVLKEKMESHFNTGITDERLNEEIKLHNDTRRLQRELYTLRMGKNPTITGTQMLAVTVAGTAMPKKHYNVLLKELMDDLKEQPGHDDYRARIMVIGGELENPEFIKIIEDQGGLVVTDSLCFGSRMFWKDIDENTTDPMKALAKYYVADRPSCPRVYGKYDERSAFVKEMIDKFHVDGVVFERLAFCDPWGFEQFSIFNDFKEWDVPLLMLDREHSITAIGQLRTRVQAFMETIGS